MKKGKIIIIGLLICILVLGLQIGLIMFGQGGIQTYYGEITTKLLGGTIATDTNTQATKSVSKTISVNSFVAPAISEEALNLIITEVNGEVIINSSVFNCKQKLPSYELNTISFSNTIDSDKFDVIISGNTYDYDYSELMKVVDSKDIKWVTEEIICDKQPTIKGCYADFGNVYLDLCDSNFDVGITYDKGIIKTTIEGANFSIRDPTIEVTNVSLGVFNNTIGGLRSVQLSPILTDGLIRYLNFDDSRTNDGTILDLTGTQDANADTWTNANIVFGDGQCKSGGCLYQSGVDDNKQYVYFDDAGEADFDLDMGNLNFTFLAWVNATDYANDDYVFEKANSTGSYEFIGRFASGSWRCYVNSTGDTFAINEPEANNLFVACRQNSTHLEAFVNGTPSGSPSASTELLGTTEDFKIGYWGTSSYFAGTIDEVMIYNRSLTNAEILAIYEGTKDIYQPSGDYYSIVHNLSYNETAMQVDAVNWSETLPTNTDIEISVRTKQFNLTDKLLGYWDFDGDNVGANLVHDISGNGNDCIPKVQSEGVVSDGLDFHGWSDDGVDTNAKGCMIPTTVYEDKVQNVTWYVRFKPDSTDRDTNMVDLGNAFMITAISSSNRIRTIASGTSAPLLQVASGQSVGVWSEIFAYYNQSHLCLDINGAETCQASTGDMTYSQDDIGIGNDRIGFGSPINGTLDNVMLWNKSLNAGERSCIRIGECLSNWSQFTPLNTTNPFEPTNITGQFDQKRWTATTTSQNVSPSLNNYSQEISDVAVGEAAVETDTTDPTVTLHNPIEKYNGSSATLKFNATVTDDGLGGHVQNVSLIIDGTEVAKNTTHNTNATYNFTRTGLSEGTHTWQINATDNSSNIASSKIRNFTIDLTDPHIWNMSALVNTNTTARLNARTQENANTTWTLFNDTSRSIEWQRISNATMQKNFTIDISGTGQNRTYYVTLTTQDIVQRTYTNNTFSFSTPKDTNPPPIIGSLSNTSHGSTYITDNYTISSDTDHVEVWRDSTFIANTTGTGYNHTGLSQGTSYHRGYRSVDIAGNKAAFVNITSSTQTSSDSDPPTITITAPANNTYITNRDFFSIDFLVSDAAATTDCDLYLDSTSSYSNNSVANNTNTTYTPQTIQPKGYNYFINCTDDVGNIGQSKIYTINFTYTPQAEIWNRDYQNTTIAAIDERGIINATQLCLWTINESNNIRATTCINRNQLIRLLTLI